MTQFFTESKTIEVSRITTDGWWLENTKEHVSKGTALGDDYTQNIYTPSGDGKIARYDRESDSWSDEIDDMTWKEYFNEYGVRFVIGEPDGVYPDSAILEEPPAFNSESETVIYREDKWAVYPIKLGESYYNEHGHEYKVSDFNFDLPDGFTWETPPKADEGYAVQFTDGKWEILPDYREKIAYPKDRDGGEAYLVKELGDLPDTHTLLEPADFDSWVDDAWSYDIERHRPVKASQEKQWRDSALAQVLDRIDQYEKDQKYPVELRTSPIQTEEEYLSLLQARKLLCDYPTSENYPFGDRPAVALDIT
ncbi:hypothetical protein [Vibrio fluvialis]|uniref:hypothetical protein n=1 Tax=Vibrio fluvialis TaxID=676 RepID=UPI001EEB4859|nr:hypothetical protein [Vibrio fluvialis]MCG6387485.1 hypothetical protein [Vibrio fluvialis]